ncbi:putative alpha/beta hydrolase, partial [Mycobacterium kansasii]
MQLRYVSVPLLIAEAGGDPWAINQSLQAGRPAQISGLAEAFHAAGRCTAEADAAFDLARRRFEAAWNRENGEHPINDSAEVQRVAQSLGAQSLQLPKIGVDLENIAATLAEAQRSASGQIAQLEGQLQQLDDEIGRAVELERNHQLTAADIAALDAFIHTCEQDAIDDTQTALAELHSIRDGYSNSLRTAEKNLAVDGYDPSRIWGVDNHEPETPDQAEQDVHDALAGDQGAAGRVNAVLGSITPDQLAGKVPLTAEQASVLSQLQAQEHGMSVDALTTAEQRLGAQRGMIANSWQLMSNPNISFPKTQLTVGAKQGSDTVKGGISQLPASVQQALNSPNAIFMHQMNDIAGIVKDGDRGFQTNTELDRAMIHKASVMMDTPIWHIDPASRGQNVERDPALDPTVSNVLSAVSPDHQVVHDTITGADHDKFLRNITHHYWKDNGQGVGSLFSWTGDPAVVQGPEEGIAAETAHVYSSYIGGHQQELLHLPGNHTLGQVNPNLVRDMAHGLGPYVNNIAGTSGGLPGFGDPLDGHTMSGALPVAKGVFSVLSSDKEAAQYFNGQAYAQAVLHEAAFADDPTHSGYDQHLYDAATLRALVDVGTHNAFQANEDNGYHQGVSEYQSKKSAYETGLQGLTTAGGFIPGVGRIAGPTIGILGHNLENAVLGPTPTAPTENPIQPMSLGMADQEILNAMLGTGHTVAGLPPGYIVYDHDHPNGRIATPE